MNDKNVKFQCPQTYFFFLLIDTSDGYSSDNISVAPDHGNSNDDGTVTTHSVVQLFFRHHQRMKILINRLLFYPFTPNMSEHGVVVALLLSLVKKHYVPQARGGSVQHGGPTRSVRRAQR